LSLGRTSPDGVLFTTYNAYDLFLDGLADGCERYRLVTGIIRDIGPDVLAVQEIRADDEDTARARLRRLADDTGLNCLVPGPEGEAPRPALAMGSHGYHVGLLWREEIKPVPGSLRLRAQDFWHALVSVGLDVGGRRVRHACYHAPPFGRAVRATESELVVAMLSNPASAVVVGADWNGESADRVPDGAGGWRLYEPRDPYQDVDWFPHMAHQCEWDYDGQGRRSHRADRSAGDVLWAGGLHDAAAALGAPWQPTAGHHPDDPYGAHGVSRRIDAIRVTGRLLGALRGYHVSDTDEARRASDHLPVTTEYLPSAIAAAPGRSLAGSAGQAS
jgi:endonuclease/exonuclease/phosphatase family metal-dependent hydrolase